MELITKETEAQQDLLNIKPKVTINYFENFEKKEYNDFFLSFFNLNSNVAFDDWFIDSIIEDYFLSFSSDFLYEKSLVDNPFSIENITKKYVDEAEVISSKIKEISNHEIGSLFFYDTSEGILSDLIGFEDFDHKKITIVFPENENNLVFDDVFLLSNNESTTSAELKNNSADDSIEDINTKKKKK